MKKKIMVFALLFALMIGLPVPVPAAANSTETTADDVKYADVEDFMHNIGYSSFKAKEGFLYVVYKCTYWEYEGLHVLGFKCDLAHVYACQKASSDTGIYVFSLNGIHEADISVYLIPENAGVQNNFEPVKTGVGSSNGAGTTSGGKFNGVNTSYFSATNYRIETWDNLVYSDVPIYSNSFTNILNVFEERTLLLYEGNRSEFYDFPLWCADAGLNCMASTNEDPNKIPYSYNSYWHIVRKTSSGKWLLTTIGNSLSQQDATLRISEDNGSLMISNWYTGDDVNGYMFNVRQYEYDTDGWKVRTYDTYDSREYDSLITLEAGTGVDDTRVLAYTSTDIYSFNGYAVMHEASTEYYEVTDTVEPEDPTATITPTPGGSSGDDSGDDDQSSSGGGRPGTGQRPEVSSSGGLTFIVDLFSMIWTEICGVPLSVDGYSITLQQVYIYGALFLIVGGFIIRFIFKR